MGIKERQLPDGISKLNPSEMKILRDTHAKSDLNRKVLGPYDTPMAQPCVLRENKIVSAAFVAGISVIVLLIIMAVFISRNAGNPVLQIIQ